MARRKSFLERVLGGGTQQQRDQRERENRSVEAHIVRSAQQKAGLERVRAEREQAKADQGQVHARLTVDLRDQDESLQFHLRRLANVLRDREHGLATTSDILAAAFRDGGAAAFTQAVQEDLSSSPYPPYLPTRTTVLAYRPEARELVIERELPRTSVIPPEQAYRIVKDAIVPVPHRAADVRHLYAQLIARVALRTLAEAFALTPPELVDHVVLNGRVTALDQGTGQSISPHLVSVRFGRARFEAINLDTPELDPELCLRRSNAAISPDPYDLVPVEPLRSDDVDRPGTVLNTDPPGDRDSRLDLLTLPVAEFETLVRELFESRGLRDWHTQASRQDEIDAVALHADPALGGIVVIQARLYSRVVPTEAVGALARAMVERQAASGILVTTSWVGRESRELARRHGRIEIIDGRELKQLLAETLHLNVAISLPVLPHGWERAQVA